MKRMSYYNRYRWCIVPGCKNTSLKTPQKLWIQVPNDIKMRNTWLKLARRDPKSLSTKSRLYFCEDHFDLKYDMENYTQYMIMGSVKQIRMKPNSVPSKFDCQANRKQKSTPSEPRHDFIKRLRISTIKDIDEAIQNENLLKSSPSCSQDWDTESASSQHSEAHSPISTEAHSPQPTEAQSLQPTEAQSTHSTEAQSSQPTEAQSTQSAEAQYSQPTEAHSPQLADNFSTTSPVTYMDEEWTPEQKYHIDTNLEPDGEAGNYGQKCMVEYNLERERLKLKNEELRVKEFEIRESLRQKDMELQMQAQWLELMKEAMKMFTKYMESKT